MLVEYWNFINRSILADDSRTGIEAMPNFYYKTVLWSLFFCALHIIIPSIVKLVYRNWLDSLNPKDRRELSSYLVCSVHHLVMVPIAWLHVYQDWLLTDEMASMVDYATLETSIGPFCIGYLMGDTLCFALPEALSMRFEYIFHHLMTLWLIISSMFGPVQLCRFIPHMLICDTTNIFFNLAWLLRRTGGKGGVTVAILEVFFGFSFLFTRVINLPLVFLSVTLSEYSAMVGWTRITFLPITALQWFWFTKILAGMMKRLKLLASAITGSKLGGTGHSSGRKTTRKSGASGPGDPNHRKNV